MSSGTRRPGGRLRELMAEGMVVAPFIFDAFTARIAEAAGFQAVYRTGHGTAARLGMPDTGLTTFSEMVDHLAYVCAAVGVPVIADADTGYGNILNVRRTVRAYEQAGAAALHLEDQVFPKKCGFFDGKQVIPLEEHVEKIHAALEARRDDDFVIIARTDALTVNGWEDTIRRAKAYYEAGADLVFLDGISTVADVETYSRELAQLGIPCLYNGGLLAADKVAELGFRVQITGPGHALAFLAVRQALRTLKGTSESHNLSPLDEEMTSVAELLGTSEISERRAV